MKKALMFAFALLVTVAVAGSAEAACDPYGFCRFGGCYTYDPVIDGYFHENCSAWSFEGAASRSSESFCNGTTDLGKIAPNSFQSTGVIAQTVYTNGDWPDDFWLDFIVEASNMGSNGSLGVYLDEVGGYSTHVATITGDQWCQNKGYRLQGYNLRGKLIKIRFQGTGTANSTVIKIDNVNFAQRTQ